MPRDILCRIAQAGGFAAGRLAGMLIEEKLAIGILVARIILAEDECRLKERLASLGYGVTAVTAEGANGQVKFVYTIVRRKAIGHVIAMINGGHSKAFYSIEDARTAEDGISPMTKANNWFGK